MNWKNRSYSYERKQAVRERIAVAKRDSMYNGYLF